MNKISFYIESHALINKSFPLLIMKFEKNVNVLLTIGIGIIFDLVLFL